MTCIVGLVDQGTVWMGGDSAEMRGWDLTVAADPKVFRNGPLLMGSTGEKRLSDLLHYGLVVPALDGDVRRWVSTVFVDACRACLSAAGFTKKDNEREESEGGFLVGVAGRLFYVGPTYSVTEAAAPYAACGCGESFALGVLYATPRLPPDSRIQRALEAAEAFSAGVRGPFTVLTLAPEVPTDG